MLEQGIMESHKEWNPTQGTPQGGVISPVLANIYLNELDHLLIRKGVHPTRYADDLVVLCDTEAEAIETLEHINGWMINNGLSLHPVKTKVIDLSQPKAEMDFLGYAFKRTGKGTQIRYPRQKSMKRYRGAIKAITKRTSGIKLSETIKRINPKARGWYNYFSDSIPNVFETMDGTRRFLQSGNTFEATYKVTYSLESSCGISCADLVSCTRNLRRYRVSFLQSRQSRAGEVLADD